MTDNDYTGLIEQLRATGSPIRNEAARALQDLQAQLEEAGQSLADSEDQLGSTRIDLFAAEAQVAALRKALAEEWIDEVVPGIWRCLNCLVEAAPASRIQHKPDCLLAPAPQGEEGKPHAPTPPSDLRGE